MDRSEIAIIIPAFNEEQSIGRVVEAVFPYGIVIVVNDASKDATSEVAARAGGIVVSHDNNQGYDAAINTGFAKASDLSCKFSVTFDADGQHNPLLIPKFADEFLKGNSMVIGVRPQPARVMEYLFAFYTHTFFGILDPLCGMKGYDMKIYDLLGWFDSYHSIGTELMLFSIRNNFPYTQVDVSISERENTSRFGSTFTANWRIFRAMAISMINSQK
jgi:glycosyltransferase involved in cell wall biosynthesis